MEIFRRHPVPASHIHYSASQFVFKWMITATPLNFISDINLKTKQEAIATLENFCIKTVA